MATEILRATPAKKVYWSSELWEAFRGQRKLFWRDAKNRQTGKIGPFRVTFAKTKLLPKLHSFSLNATRSFCRKLLKKNWLKTKSFLGNFWRIKALLDHSTLSKACKKFIYFSILRSPFLNWWFILDPWAKIHFSFGPTHFFLATKLIQRPRWLSEMWPSVGRRADLAGQTLTTNSCLEEKSPENCIFSFTRLDKWETLGSCFKVTEEIPLASFIR